MSWAIYLGTSFDKCLRYYRCDNLTKLGTKSSSEDVSASKNYLILSCFDLLGTRFARTTFTPRWTGAASLDWQLPLSVLSLLLLLSFRWSTFQLDLGWSCQLCSMPFLKINFLNSDFILCSCFGGQSTSWGLSLHPFLILEKTINVIHTSLKSLRLDWNIETNQTIPLQKSNSKIHVRIFIQR